MVGRRFSKQVKDFAWYNKEGAILGVVIGGLFALFNPLYSIAVLVFSYVLPASWMSGNTLKIMLPLFGLVIGVIIDQLIEPKK